MEELNIVDLIENNPIIKLSNNYNSKLLSKIKTEFTECQQQLFVSSFYCYLNYHSKLDFVIDFDNIWKWLEFSKKDKAKRLLENCFILNTDYIILLPQSGEQNKGRGGHNKEIIMLNINTFKFFCLKAGTKKADEIHKYFIRLEEMLQEVINEESNELKLQLIQKDKIIEQSEKDKEKLKEETILEQFPLNTQCIYIGKIDNQTQGKPNSKMYHETVIKFGQSNNLSERVKCHKNTYTNFRLYAAYKVKNKIEIENAIKKHPLLQKRIRLITTEDTITHRELLALDDKDFTIEKVEQYIKEIIKQNEYNIENYNLLLHKNACHEEEINKLKEELEQKNKQITDITIKLNAYTGEGDLATYTKNKIASNYTICKYGYYMYIYQYDNMRFICSISRQKDFEALTTNLNNLYPNGEMKYHKIVSYTFSEKNMMFLLKQHCLCLGNNKFESYFNDVKMIIDISIQLEELLIKNAKDLPLLQSIIANETNNVPICYEISNPEVPTVRKAKRSIDQINKDTGEIIATYESIEAAGRAIQLTTGTAVGIALRESRVCKGFLWRYTGISKEEQFNDQPVIKICCSTGEKVLFKTIADAARDSNISAPALRNRIITQVHTNFHHWIFDKDSTHYNI
jgi:hypothetical protein